MSVAEGLIAGRQITRDCRNLTIFGETNEVSGLYMALPGLEGPGMCGEMRAAVDITLGNPIKGFGVLTDYAEALEPGDGGRALQKIIVHAATFERARGYLRMAHNVRRAHRKEDGQMDMLAGFILDNGSYPWDIVS